MVQDTIQVTSFDMSRLFAMAEQLRKQGATEIAGIDQL